MRLSTYVSQPLASLAAVTVTAAGPGSGTITGKITYEGTPAKQKPIDMSKEPSCAAKHPTPITTETVVTGPGNSSGKRRRVHFCGRA